MDTATVDYSQWPEGGHTIRVLTTGYESSRDVFFKVSGLYSNNYRRDTGTYRLIVTVEGSMGVWYGLGILQDEVRHRIPSHHDIRALSHMHVEFAIVKAPDNPGDPFVLAAIDYVSGSVINYYKFNPSEYKSVLPFRMELKAFNKAQMGPMSRIMKQTMKAPRKSSPYHV